MSQAIFYVPDSNAVPSGAIKLTVGAVCNKTTLLTALGQACDFPSYYSLNWDSAYDCLTDSEIYALQLSLVGSRQVEQDDLATFKRIIEDAYEQFSKPILWIVGDKTHL